MKIMRDQLQLSLQHWLMRKTGSKGVRHVGDLPIALVSDIGLVRAENQDRLAVLRVNSRTRSFLVAALCDGIGGMADGATCASVALSSFLVACIRNRGEPFDTRLATAASIANESVFANFRGRGGATLSAFIVDSADAIAAINVGDSRIYGVTGDRLKQLTIDDTIAGQLNHEKQNLDDHPGHRELLQYIGIGPGLEPHPIPSPLLSESTTLFLTTDGIHIVNHEVLESVVRHAKEPATAIQRLSELSTWYGGKDNASAISATRLSIHATDNYFPSGIDPNIIEVWDAYGDLQIVGVDRDPKYQADSPQHSLGHLEANEIRETEQSNIKGEQPRQKSKDKKIKKDKRKTREKPDDQNKIIKEDAPQLKIDLK